MKKNYNLTKIRELKLKKIPHKIIAEACGIKSASHVGWLIHQYMPELKTGITFKPKKENPEDEYIIILNKFLGVI